jgi:thiamine-monophosphate kinase
VASEWDRIEALRITFAAPSLPGVVVGIGDDAAVLAPGPEPLVWTVDAAVDGVHFRRDLLSFVDIGYRATMAAASDLAAMGAAPRGLLAALVLPPSVGDVELALLATGQREAADALGTAILGGNLARGTELSITTTALGAAPAPLTRTGALPGDALWAAGALGLAAAGLAFLLAGRVAVGPPDRAAVRSWRRPEAQIAAGIAARGWAHAAIDVSDGLAQDVRHLARASAVDVVLDAAAILSPELERIAADLGRDPLELALHGGEDYALIVAAPDGPAPDGFTRIGWILRHAGAGSVQLAREDGAIVAVGGRGFDHFA